MYLEVSALVTETKLCLAPEGHTNLYISNNPCCHPGVPIFPSCFLFWWFYPGA